MAEEMSPSLTAEQEETADFLLEECGLQELADVQLEMMGQSGTVRYGLGRCAHYLANMTPDEVRDMVMLKLEQQQGDSTSGA